MSSNLTTKTRYINIVISDKDNKLHLNSIKTAILKYDCNCLFALILHNQDCDDNYILKTKHYHAVITLSKTPRLSTYLTYLSNELAINPLSINIEKCSSVVGAIQYLTHKNDKDKHQYNFDDIVHNYDINEFDTIYNSVNNSLTFDYIYNICIESNNLLEVIKKVGFTTYHIYRNVINDIWKQVILMR